MPEIERRLPRPATCEEWNEETQTTLPDSRITANASLGRSAQELISRQKDVKFRNNGADSGYASRADTVSTGSTSTGRRKMHGLRVETGAVPEREPQPYSMSHVGPSKVSTRRQSLSQGNGSAVDPRPAKSKQNVHEPGLCWSCDQYGKHIDMTREMSRASSAVPPPPSPTAVRQSGLKTVRDDASLPVKVRRPSSARPPRPLSMVSDHASPAHYVNQVVYGSPAGATPGWATPIMPSMPYSPVSWSYGPTPNASSSYTPFPPVTSYFDPASTSEPYSAKPSRQSSPARHPSGYGEPVIRQGYHEHPVATLERMTLRDSRPVIPSHRSSHSIDHDRAMMPPPAKPRQPEVGMTRRPSTRRASTYHPEEAPPRQRFSYEEDRYDRGDEESDYREARTPLSTVRERRESLTHPPTSYRAPAVVEARGRPPLPRKSASCSTPAGLTKAESSRPPTTGRHTTLPTIPLEDKVTAAEEYLDRSSKTSNELTAEALRNLNHRNSASRSEASSSYSHKSRHSSSKESSGLGKSQATTATKTSITLPGGLNMSIPSDYMKKDGGPLSIKVGGFVVSVGAEEVDSVERPREHRRIERAPSVTSRASKKSASSGISSREKDRDRDVPPQSSRRLSQVEERGPSARSSRQPSRAPSTTERTYEYSRRQSVDYSKPFEEVMYGA
ncbi:hypothetical protein A1O1_03890 [Capronia coronata CBS 617.96]|uniref:Uncharacterized protein n=1 Tax=Capronia coronata CBS 617.96 TaxID=1182541 RepID=W9YNH3_9EURO|nr:uncharacterized protein A1O1_03890 [Capronia coronata CBS 617.96]EXJ90786.1 hypothetical protein A1O1_03890 [Capronia coronata CBS 617.96]